MKKIISFLLIICMLCPFCTVSANENTAKVHLFGDEWAQDWGKELSGYVENTAFINCATKGDLLSLLEKKAEYKNISSLDTVIISYGVMEKDRPGDKNADFKKNLEKITQSLTKKGARVIFASICSTMRFNSFTGKMEETKNFYTETTKEIAKKNNITYIDLAALTANMANKLGGGNIHRLYKAPLSLTGSGVKMCAHEVFCELSKIESLGGILKNNFYSVTDFVGGKTEIDLFYEETLFDEFVIYIKGGVNVRVNSNYLPDGDSNALVKSENGKITVEALRCEKIQVSPVYRFEGQGVSTTENPYTNSLLPGVYDVTVKKSESLKASVYLNGYMIAANLDMPGTEAVTFASEHTFKNYHHETDKINVKITGLTDKLDYIYFAPSPIIYEEKPVIYLAGDSTVCNYYPLARSGNEADGTVMTGWGMLLSKYVDAQVVNFAASGEWASKWYAERFEIVEKEGKKGDYFVIQFGINDHDKSTLDDMTTSLNAMIDRVSAKGIIPILVSPQISAGYGWGDVGEVGKSDGGKYEEFFSAVRKIAEKRGVFYVDLTDLSAGWFSEVGREGVYKKYHLWDYENNKPSDMMHLSYKGADAMCRFFVLGLKKLQSTNATDNWGNNLSLLKIW